ncbi:hypothetical protein EPD60_11770 [Flaviaesturariibacter flavus]|uniref:SMP-30/Gluconolactonase/LRE-like region domain-containing protein n=1 Tax=Flaviaesturariibacter flavus TaxID=2502780 RepID=A0A4R1BA02_9BACT|nr:hypothetical protein [Flaviaesturariibacter flavus]TCJ13765.1 hypothetical protein EPD60_11770 [Flaviaesturariibacter flavus]
MRSIVSILTLTLAIVSCSGKPAPGKHTLALEKPAYRLDQPLKSWRLADELLEISGISWINDRQLLAIEDATRNLYVLDLSQGAAVSRKTPITVSASGKLDIEDVTLVGPTAYTLRSNGELIEIDGWDKQATARELPSGLPDGLNVEGICFDPVSGNLLLAEKDRLGKKKKMKKSHEERAIYSFDPRTGKLLPEPFLEIGPEAMAKMGGGKGSFNPSAIAVHPKTKEIYVLGSAGIKGLACFGRDGELKWFTPISNARMPQPEGLCFAPDGTLFISSEGNGKTPGQLFEFAAP